MVQRCALRQRAQFGLLVRRIGGAPQRAPVGVVARSVEKEVLLGLPEEVDHVGGLARRPGRAVEALHDAAHGCGGPVLHRQRGQRPADAQDLTEGLHGVVGAVRVHPGEDGHARLALLARLAPLAVAPLAGVACLARRPARRPRGDRAGAQDVAARGQASGGERGVPGAGERAQRTVGAPARALGRAAQVDGQHAGLRIAARGHGVDALHAGRCQRGLQRCQRARVGVRGHRQGDPPRAGHRRALSLLALRTRIDRGPGGRPGCRSGVTVHRLRARPLREHLRGRPRPGNSQSRGGAADQTAADDGGDGEGGARLERGAAGPDLRAHLLGQRSEQRRGALELGDDPVRGLRRQPSRGAGGRSPRRQHGRGPQQLLQCLMLRHRPSQTAAQSGDEAVGACCRFGPVVHGDS